MLERWTGAMLRHRFLILATWLLIIVLGIFASAHVNDRLTTALGVPGSQSAQADKILSSAFHENPEGTFTIFYKFKSATKAEIEGFKTQINNSISVIPNAHVLQSRALAGVLFTSVGTSFDLPRAAEFTVPLRISLKAHGLTGALVTGPPAIKSDVTPVMNKDLRRGEFIAITLALLLLLLVLGISWAAIVPLIFATATITSTLGFVYLLSRKFVMVLYVPNIVELIGLGLAIDYSLLIVQRFRRELESKDVESAISSTMRTSGRTILFSGATVALGLSTLMLVPVPFIRSLGLAGVLVPILSIVATLTLQPALLSYLGREGVATYGFAGLLGRSEISLGFIARATRAIIGKPLLTFLGALTLLSLLISPIFSLHVTPSSLTAIPAQLESAQAMNIVTGAAGKGAITPSEILIDLGSAGMAPRVNEARNAFATLISNDPEVFLIANGEKDPYVDVTGRYLRMYVIGKHDLGARQTQELVKTIRNSYIPKAEFPAGTKIYLGGTPAQGSDLLHRIFVAFPIIVLLMLLFTFLLLRRAFASIFLPIKAILLDLLSIAASFGVVVAIVRFGIGSKLFHTYHLPQIEAWVLIFLFAILFGLSMDYEVFIVSRIREAWDRGETNEVSIVEGLSHTGGVVTAAAAILIVAVSGLANSHFAGLQELGLGLAFGILIDATIIRGLLLPSAMTLLGKWNWWNPRRSRHK